jgi:hypothetical protein
VRLKVEVKLESEPYSDMFPPIDLAHGIPNAGDELLLSDVAYTCTKRRFQYDDAGRLKSVAIFVKR